MAFFDFLYPFRLILDALERIEVGQLRLEARMSAIQDAVDTLTQKVEDVATVDDSIITLLNGISQQLRDLVAAGNIKPADLLALADKLETDNQKIRDAVTANTTPTP
jgi:hypothetical protein